MSGKRQSGRTHRMLQEAIRLVEEGEIVFIAAGSISHILDLKFRLADMSPATLPAVRFIHTNGPGWDWHSLSVRGESRQVHYLVDHFAIEHTFAKALEELTRYDRPEGEA